MGTSPPTESRAIKEEVVAAGLTQKSSISKGKEYIY